VLSQGCYNIAKIQLLSLPLGNQILNTYEKVNFLQILQMKKLFLFLSLFCWLPTCYAQVHIPYIKYTYDELPALNNGAGFYHCKYFSAIYNTEIGYLIYLPKHYFEVPDTIFPVLYYLHGSGGNYIKESSKAIKWQDSTDNIFPEMVIVLTNLIDDSYSLKNGEASIADELRNHIINTYRVSDQGECTAICGFSMGGQGAMQLSLRHSQQFSQVVSLSGAPFMGLEDHISYYLTNGTGKLKIRATTGTEDIFRSSSYRLKEELESAGIPFDYKEYEGIEHNATKIFNDSTYRTETFLWQKENLLSTCPVTIRNAELPIIGEYDLPFVDEYNPMGSTPVPPDGFMFYQISPFEFQLSWNPYPEPFNGYILQQKIKDAPGFRILDTVSSETLMYIDSLEIACDSIYTYQLLTFNDVGPSSSATYLLRAGHCSTSNSPAPEIPPARLYPNPSHNRIFIELEENLDLTGVLLLITGSNGKIMLKQHAFKRQVELDISNFSPGNYYTCIIKNDKCINTYKFTVE
jgi:hypothetical protein